MLKCSAYRSRYLTPADAMDRLGNRLDKENEAEPNTVSLYGDEAGRSGCARKNRYTRWLPAQ